MRSTFLFIVIVLFYSCNSYSQTNLQFEISGGKYYNFLDQGILNNWGDGWAVGGGLGYRILPHSDLIFNLTYSHYPFTGNNIFLTFPAVVGFEYNVSGEPSNVYEASIGIKFNSNIKYINPFISLNTGLYIINAGNIIISNWIGPNPHNVSHYKYFDSGNSSTNLFAGIGIGFMVPVYSNLSIGFEARFNVLFNSNGSFQPLMASIQYSL